MFRDNAREFQKGFDPEERRRNREDDRYRLRKQDRERRFQKQRRVEDGNHSSYVPGGGGLTPSVMDPITQQMLQELPGLVEGVWSEDFDIQYQCCSHIRKLLSIERNPPIQQVIDTGVVPRLVQLLKNTNCDKLQFETAWALTNIASGSAEHTSVVIRSGACPIFVRLLEANAIEVQEQAVWALGNIAGDSPECRNLVLNNGALPKLLTLCDPHVADTEARSSLLRNATWTLSNFCRGKPQPPFELIHNVLPTLHILLYVDDEEVLQDTCWGFSYLSDVDSERGEDTRIQQQIVNDETLGRLVELLDHPSNNVKHPALRTIGNIVTGDDIQTQKVIDLGALHKLHNLLENEKKSIKKETCWAISNITAGNIEQIEAVIKNNLIQPLILLLLNDEFDVQKEAAWGISNATSGGSSAQIRFLVENGAISPLCNLFLCHSPRIIMVALEGIENILRIGKEDRQQFNDINRHAQFVEECGGLDNLEQLQARDDIPDDIYEKAISIIKEFWDTTDDSNAVGITAQIDPSGEQFTFGHNTLNGQFPDDSTDNQPFIF